MWRLANIDLQSLNLTKVATEYFCLFRPSKMFINVLNIKTSVASFYTKELELLQ